jgi:solute carrier family 25 phosphate transporter 23/24/25/41
VTGDVSLSAEDRPLAKARQATLATPPSPAPVDHEHEVDEAPEVDDEPHHWLGGMTALKFLVAGGMAGAVSRTATAPFDRLKIFLITRPPDLGGAPQASGSGARAIASAVARIYAEGGVRGFWVGNGLSIVKIFPESAIKFLSYESSVGCRSCFEPDRC